MLGAKHPNTDAQNGAMLSLGLLKPVQVVKRAGKTVLATESIGMLGAQYPSADVQYGAVFGLGFLKPSQSLQGSGEIRPAGQGARVLQT
jgi:hypothetical protein